MNLLLASLTALVALAATPGPPQVIYGRCEGVGKKMPGLPPTFDCNNINCAPGCKKVATTTPFGAGEVCQCNYIGPQPNCCALVFVPGAPGFTTQGDCNAPGCPTVGTCVQIITPGVPIVHTAECVIILPPDGGDDGGGDDDGDGG